MLSVLRLQMRCAVRVQQQRLADLRLYSVRTPRVKRPGAGLGAARQAQAQAQADAQAQAQVQAQAQAQSQAKAQAPSPAPPKPTAQKPKPADPVQSKPAAKNTKANNTEAPWKQEQKKKFNKPVQDSAKKSFGGPPKKKVQLRKSPVKRTVLIPKSITLANYAHIVNTKYSDLVTLMTQMGFENLRHDYLLGESDAKMIAEELNLSPVVDDTLALDIFPAPPPSTEELAKMPFRPPIVTIMGHVDHGKTTILDYLRKASVAASEHGGITQHIGAFSVRLSSKKEICFLDTPGHAAFLNMRERGANVTDIVVLVVAADDSVMPQTKEAIKHAHNAAVPVIVAINKCDKPSANPKKVVEDLSANGVDVEDYGGDTQTVQVSGKTGKGIDELEEAIITLSEMLEIRAPKTGAAEGYVIESQVKKGQGNSATVLVRRGTLKVGSFVVAGHTWAKVRSMRDSAGAVVKQAGPGTPVEVTGWKELPVAGDEMLQAKDENLAKKVADTRVERGKMERETEEIGAINEKRLQLHQEQEREHLRQERLKLGLSAEAEAEFVDTSKEDASAGPIVVPFIIKADVSGSAEAVADSIQGLGNGEVQSSVLYKGVGAINDTDLARAEASGAIILTFNVATERDIGNKAQAKHVRIAEHKIIYKLLEEVTAELAGRLEPEIKHKVLGEATIKEVFSITMKRSKSIHIAGTRVTNGLLARGAKVKVLRDGEVVYVGTFSSLKHFKDEVETAKKDTDCGVGFSNWEKFEVGDVIQTFEEITIPRHF